MTSRNYEDFLTPTYERPFRDVIDEIDKVKCLNIFALHIIFKEKKLKYIGFYAAQIQYS